MFALARRLKPDAAASSLDVVPADAGDGVPDADNQAAPPEREKPLLGFQSPATNFGAGYLYHANPERLEPPVVQGRV